MPVANGNAAQDAVITSKLRFDCPPLARAASAGSPRQEDTAVTVVLDALDAWPATNPAPLLRQFIRQHPDSRWTPALRFLLGDRLYRQGSFSGAEAEWEGLWNDLKGRPDAPAMELANMALHRLLRLKIAEAKRPDIERLLKEIEGRDLDGATKATAIRAREEIFYLNNKAFQHARCGPVALDSIKHRLGEKSRSVEDEDFIGPDTATKGISCRQLKDLSAAMKLNHEVVLWTPGIDKLPTPAVVHWKHGHFSALLDEKDGKYLLEDQGLRFRRWVSLDELEGDFSGYFLVPTNKVPASARRVPSAESDQVFGSHCAHSTPPGSEGTSGPNGTIGGVAGPSTGPINPPGPPPCSGMPSYTFHTMMISLLVVDTPLFYRPPVGLPVNFNVSYRQLDDGQDSASLRTYANFGNQWTFDFFGYVQLFSTNLLDYSSILCRMPEGGTEYYTYRAAAGQTDPHPMSHAFIRPTGPNIFERIHPDGSKEVYSVPQHTYYTDTRFFLSAVVDPSGNQLSMNYDAYGRLAFIVDGIGQTNTLSYELTNSTASPNFFKVTKVTDPFGRTAIFTYNAAGQLWTITDMGNLSSSFTYSGGDFIIQMTTPYGTTSFGGTVGGGQHSLNRSLTATDPLGQTEMVSREDPAAVPAGEAIVPSSSVLVGNHMVHLLIGNENLHFRNTLYWSKRAYLEAMADPANHANYATLYHWLVQGSYEITGIPESIKNPLESRIWYNYPDQYDPHFVGSSSSPIKVVRVLDDLSAQLYQYEYNSIGNIINTVDPVGRTFSYTYASNQLDLVEVHQIRTGNELLMHIDYDSRHLPTNIVDAAGQTNALTYNTVGQLLTRRDPLDHTWTYGYDNQHYLRWVDGPLPGTNDQTSFTYDAMGKTRTVTESDGYMITYAYDSLNRLTNITFPDGTFEGFTYDKLDLVANRDREGRVTTHRYDALRHLVETVDPLLWTNSFQWCNCGLPEGLIDAMGRISRWHYDIQGRRSAKEYADGSRVQYFYENNTSRLARREDEKGQITQYEYFADDNRKRVSYPNATSTPTPTVSFTYDAAYNRLITVDDGIGHTAYTYYAVTVPPQLGDGRLSAVNGPWTNDTIMYQYDALGRVTNRVINGLPQTSAFDRLGRLTTLSNVLGRFAYDYDAATLRVTNVAYPNGAWSKYTYFDNVKDRRLQEISHMLAGGQPLARFAYAYTPAGNITNWLQQLSNEVPRVWSIQLDPSSQITNVIVNQGTNTIQTFAWGYDPAGNRVVESVDGSTRHFNYNLLNQLANTTDLSTTNISFEWDAEQRLMAINRENHRTTFRYDGLGRRAELKETEAGVVQSTQAFLWSELTLCGARDIRTLLTQRFFDQGLLAENSEPLFYFRDHLGSIACVARSDGSIYASYTYSPWGQRTRVQGQFDVPHGFTSFWQEDVAGLLLAPYRAYQSVMARWLSRDPLLENSVVNLYAYVQNNPISRVDPLGLQARASMPGGGAVTACELCQGDINQACNNAGLDLSTVVIGAAICRDGKLKNPELVRKIVCTLYFCDVPSEDPKPAANREATLSCQGGDPFTECERKCRSLPGTAYRDCVYRCIPK
jgi:RHS repeat-associated protein